MVFRKYYKRSCKFILGVEYINQSQSKPVQYNVDTHISHLIEKTSVFVLRIINLQKLLHKD